MLSSIRAKQLGKMPLAAMNLVTKHFYNSSMRNIVDDSNTYYALLILHATTQP